MLFNTGLYNDKNGPLTLFLRTQEEVILKLNRTETVTNRGI
jgi:hypothetical protein